MLIICCACEVFCGHFHFEILMYACTWNCVVFSFRIRIFMSTLMSLCLAQCAVICVLSIRGSDHAPLCMSYALFCVVCLCVLGLMIVDRTTPRVYIFCLIFQALSPAEFLEWRIFERSLPHLALRIWSNFRPPSRRIDILISFRLRLLLCCLLLAVFISVADSTCITLSRIL